MRNILDKLPRDAQVEIKRRVRDVFYAPSLEMAQDRAAEVLADYREAYPAAMRSFNDDLEACLVYLRCPLRHQRSIRTTNLLERACLKLVISALWKTSQRWRAVTTTELERQQQALLRQELCLPLYPGQETHVHR
jgi:transposase-like protein